MPYSRTTAAAMTGAALMVAHQVAGKAVRDSFFLSNYPASDLPRMVILAAAVTVVLVLLFAHAMTRYGPQRLVPAGFLLSSMLHAAEFRVMDGNPRLWSVLIYLHIVALGAILLSGFWSVMAESFDPRTAKQMFGRITGAGTAGGIVGGLLAERMAAVFSAASVLLLLAAFHLLCCGVLARMRSIRPGPPAAESGEAIGPAELLRRAPYLVSIAVLVLSGTAAAAIVDYLFKAGAGAAFGKGAPLLRFFAVFYTSTQVLTFFAQTWLAPRSLLRFGLGRTISALPAGLGSGALGLLLAPVFPAFTLLRSLELALRGSFHRAGYELLYTPVPAAEKRAAKTFIDVGCDRAGDALGSGVVQLMLWFGPSFIPSGLLGMMLVLAAAGVWAASRLDRTYSGLVRQRLIDRAVELDLDDIQDSTTRSALVETPVPSPAPKPPPKPAADLAGDETVCALRELRSGDSRRVLAALAELEVVRPVEAAQLVSLLAWDEVSEAVRQTLEKSPGPFTGLLIDHLTNGEVEFGIRRRIPRILAQCGRQLAVEGLVAGLADVRFEVRFQCSRALDTLLQRKPELKAPAGKVFEAVERELQVARPIRDSRRLLDQRDESDPNAFLDEILRERADQSLEHIFSLFATVLPREPVKIAFRGLHTDDRSLRGLAYEYLDSVLPASVKPGLWAMLESGPPAPPPDVKQAALSELLRNHESLMLLTNPKKTD